MNNRIRQYDIVPDDFMYHISLLYEISFEVGCRASKVILEDLDKNSYLYKALLAEFASRLNNKYFVFCEEDYFIFCGKKTHHLVCASEIEFLLKIACIRMLSKLVGKIHPKMIGELARQIKKECGE